jgi:hypothetical protein
VTASTLGVLVGVAVAVHYIAGLDWPWAIVAGAAVSMIVRGLLRARNR